LRDFAAIVPVSARQRFQLDRLENESAIPAGNPPMFDPEDVTDRSERFMAAEIIREKSSVTPAMNCLIPVPS